MNHPASTSQPGAKKLGAGLGALLVAGNVIGSGIFLLPATLGAIGSVSLVGWFIALAGAVAVAGVFSCLAVLRPHAGGIYCDIADGLGPAAGFIAGLLYWCPINNAPLAVALTGYIGFFVPALTHGLAATLTSIAGIWVMIGANIIGPRFIARISGGLLALGLAPILLVMVLGLFHFSPAVFAASWNVSGRSALAVVPGTVVMAFFAFLGIEVATICAPLMRNPARDVPLATFGGLALAAAVFIGSSAVMMGLLPAARLAHSTAPFADAAYVLLGGSIAALVALCAMAKVAGSFAVGVLATVETADSPAVLGRLMGVRQQAGPSRPNLLLIGAALSAMIAASASPTIARQFAIVADVSVVLVLICYLGAALALLRFSNAAVGRIRWVSRVAGVLGAVFSVGCIAASERALLVYAVGAVALAGLVWLVLRGRLGANATTG